jgi:mono/diheme cytochrome c family protein
MKRRVLPVVAVVVGFAGLGALQAQAPTAPPTPRKIVKVDHPGRTAFEHQCAPCHGAGPGDDGSPLLPGTMALATKHRGRLPGELELRTDLDANALRYFVRNGSGAMPMFRKAELSDAEIDAIAGYLAATAKANK